MHICLCSLVIFSSIRRRAIICQLYHILSIIPLHGADLSMLPNVNLCILLQILATVLILFQLFVPFHNHPDHFTIMSGLRKHTLNIRFSNTSESSTSWHIQFLRKPELIWLGNIFRIENYRWLSFLQNNILHFGNLFEEQVLCNLHLWYRFQNSEIQLSLSPPISSICSGLSLERIISI